MAPAQSLETYQLGAVNPTLDIAGIKQPTVAPPSMAVNKVCPTCGSWKLKAIQYDFVVGGVTLASRQFDYNPQEPTRRSGKESYAPGMAGSFQPRRSHAAGAYGEVGSLSEPVHFIALFSFPFHPPIRPSGQSRCVAQESVSPCGPLRPFFRRTENNQPPRLAPASSLPSKIA